MATQTMSVENPVKTMREILGLPEDPFALPAEDVQAPEELPVNLPVQEEAAEQNEPVIEETMDEIQAEVEAEESRVQPEAVVKRGFFSKDLVRYPLIFVISLGLFFLVFNFGAFTSRIAGWFSPPPDNQEAVLGAKNISVAEYNRWVEKFYVFLSNKEVLAANNDADGDGLTNLDEYYLDTNPLKTDTDNDGTSDGDEVINGLNPLYKGRLTNRQEDVLGALISADTVEDRIDFSTELRQQSQVNGSGLNSNTSFGSSSSSQRLPASDGISQPTSPTLYTPTVFPIDIAKAGNLKIPRLGTDVAIVWSQVFENMTEDLKWGVAHHPYTPFPGEPGMSSIHGHSSGYPWDGKYKTVFTKLDQLVAGDEVFVTVFASDGESRTYRYVVRTCKVYEKDDPAQFENLGGYHLNLSTSWPVGTAKQRFACTTELTGI